MEWLVNVKEDGSNPIRHKNLMPVTSGLEYKVKELENGTYRLEQLTVNGKQIEDDAVYSVSMFGDIEYIENSVYCGCPMPEELKSKIELQDTNVYTLFRTALADGQQFAEPSEYVSFKR